MTNQTRRIIEFLENVASADGVEALSDAKRVEVANTRRVAVIEDAGAVVALAVVARHQHADGSHHWAVETVVDPGLRFAEFEDRVLVSALQLAPRTESVTVWSHRRSLNDALVRAGYSADRTLAFLTIPLPLPGHQASDDSRAFRTSDIEAVVSINAAAFASHREALSLDAKELDRLMSQDGFSFDGLRIIETEAQVAGFCLTRIHATGDGEIYRIAVHPQFQGRGIGRQLLAVGFRYLAAVPTVRRGTLWMDTSDSVAMRMYTGIGMTQERVNTEFQRSSQPNR